MNSETIAKESPNTTPNPKKKMTATQKILIVGIVIIVIVIGVVGYLVYQMLNKEDAPSNSYLVNEDNLSQVVSEMQEQVSDGMYRVNMNTVWTFEDSSKPSSDAYVMNQTTNTKDVYLTVALQDTNELVYTSGVIPVGSSLGSFTLDEPLKKGTYNAVCTYHLLDEEQNEVSSLSVTVTLIIQN